MKKRRFIVGLAFLLPSVVIPSASHASALYLIHGTVHDLLGNPLAGAQVSDGQQSVFTNGVGAYELPEDLPGTYCPSASMPHLESESKCASYLLPDLVAPSTAVDFNLRYDIDSIGITPSTFPSVPTTVTLTASSFVPPSQVCLTANDIDTGALVSLSFVGTDSSGESTWSASETIPSSVSAGYHTVSFLGALCSSGLQVTNSPTDSYHYTDSIPGGVSDTTITIGIHAPVTGAAPIRADAFNIGKDLYWNWLKSQGMSIHGRNVVTDFMDDHYNPQTATAACQQMDTQDNVFMLIGVSGTDEVSACAFYANQHGIPYGSVGVTKSGTDYGTYFGLTSAYADQMPLLAQYIHKLGSGEDRYSGDGVSLPDGSIKIAMVSPDTPNFADARDALVSAVNALGAPYQVRVFLVSHDENPSDAPALAANIRQWGADIISPITAPVFTIALAQATASQQYKPRYVGVGVTNASNQAIANECQQSAFSNPQAMFFMPGSAWAQRNDYDPDFDKAVAATPGAASLNTAQGGGDLMWLLWGISKNIYHLLMAAGQNLTRNGFLMSTQAYSSSTQTDFTNLNYSQSKWGAYQVHALVGDCTPNNEQWIEDPNNPGLHSSF